MSDEFGPFVRRAFSTREKAEDWKDLLRAGGSDDKYDILEVELDDESSPPGYGLRLTVHLESGMMQTPKGKGLYYFGEPVRGVLTIAGHAESHYFTMYFVPGTKYDDAVEILYKKRTEVLERKLGNGVYHPDTLEIL